MSAPGPDPYWNTNVARHPGILRAVPPRCQDALDVGCGDGLLARKLTTLAQRVTGIDKSPAMADRARKLSADQQDIRVIEGDFLAADLPVEGFDFICSVTTIHHMDFEAALARMRDLLRPGGTLVVVGLARDATAADWAFRIAAAPLVRIIKRLRSAAGPEGMPTLVPHMSYDQIRAVAQQLLPGARYHRHLLRRYSLIWDKPAP
jgi:SAM-dependent methyltransferase